MLCVPLHKIFETAHACIHLTNMFEAVFVAAGLSTWLSIMWFTIHKGRKLSETTVKKSKPFLFIKDCFLQWAHLGSTGLADYDTITGNSRKLYTDGPIQLSANSCKKSSNLVRLTIKIWIPGDIQSETCRAQVSGTNQGITRTDTD
jgi:hypothetical protein